MIVVDTSVWVEFLRATGRPAHRYLADLIGRRADLATTDPIVMEVLAGAHSDSDAMRLREQLLAFEFLPVGLPDFEAAASIHRACRRAGEPIRGQIDCLIAAVAIRGAASLLHVDTDFEIIARHSGLRVEPIE